VSVSANAIEEFVRTTLSSEELTDPTTTLQRHEFADAWRRLGERQQMATLPDVLKEVRFDPNGGTTSITLAEDALIWVGRQ
jgi:hypothetical protein